MKNQISKIQDETIQITVKKPVDGDSWTDVAIYLIKVLNRETTPNYDVLISIASYAIYYNYITPKQQKTLEEYAKFAKNLGLL